MLLKQMIVEGAFGSTPDASSWSTPIAYLEREVSPADVTRLLQAAEETLREGCKKGAHRHGNIEIDG